MIDRSPMIVAPLARWSSRFAVFSASLLVVGVVLHRLTSFPTHVAVNLFAVGAAGMGLAMLAGLDRSPADLAARARGGRQGRLRRPAAPADAGLAAHLRAGLHEPAAHQRRHHRCGRPAPLRLARQGAHGRRQPGRLSGRAFRPGAAEGLSRPAHLRRWTAGWRRPSSWSRRSCASSSGRWRPPSRRPRSRPRAACSRRPT